MILIDYYKDTVVRIWADNDKNLSLVFSPIISAKFVRKGTYWTCDIRELDKLVKNLDFLGLEKAVDDETIEKFMKYVDEQNKFKGIKEGNCTINSEFKTKPFREQRIGIAYLSERYRSGIFDEMGLGKTKQVLDTLKIWRLKGKVRGNGVVICPNTAKYAWSEEIGIHSDFTHYRIGNGTPQCKTDINYIKKNPKDLFVVHIDCLRYVVNELETLNPSFVFIDEFHLFKNVGTVRSEGSLRSQALFQLLEKWQKKNPSLKIIIMTGTPVAERPEEAYAVLKILMPDFISSYSRFQNRFCKFEETYYPVWKTFKGGKKQRVRTKVREVVGYKNLSELKALIESVSIRRLKSEVEDFPEKIELKKFVVLDGNHSRDYEIVKKATREEVLKLTKSGKPFNVKNKFIRLMQIVNNPSILGGENYSSKYNLLDELLDEILASPEEKVVLWSIFRKSIELLYDRYNKKYGVDCIFGDVPIEDRGDVIKRFKSEGRPKILLCNPQAAGTSLNLERAQTAIYVDMMFSLTQRLQSEDRIHRRSSKGVVRIISIVAKGTVDEGLIELLKQKKNMKDALLTSDDILIEQNKGFLLEFLK